MNLKRNRIILLAVLILLVPLAYLAHQLIPALALIPLVGWLILYLAMVHLLWRCPHCDGYLGKVNKVPTHCPHCGKELLNDTLKKG